VENELLFTPDQHAVVGHLFAVALGAHVVGFIYFLAARERLAPRYRMATVLSMAVMAASGLLFLRLATSWDAAFVQDGATMVPTGNRFDGGLRYVNWLVTVPVLLVQVLFAFDLPRSRVLRLRTVLVASGVAMVALGYVGQFRLGRDDAWALGWGTASTVPFVVLLVVLVPLLRSQADRLPAEAGTTLRHLSWVFLFFWGLYPLAYLVPVASFTPEGACCPRRCSPSPTWARRSSTACCSPRCCGCGAPLTGTVRPASRRTVRSASGPRTSRTRARQGPSP
jgi:bacteriorhodopsin